jgi:SsrA-binding protein
MSETKSEGERVVATNRKARHEYFLLETFEAGIALKGTEVKSLREGKASLQESYATIKNGEVWLVDMHVSPYERGAVDAHEPTRMRKLLLHKKEIRRLLGKLTEKGLTLVPTRVYFKNGIAKVELALARGKRAYDKREAIKRREAQREVERHFAE